jgi:exopolysaccharide biosynthesis polyprenyl glycosylphosphotransferase
MTAEVHAGPIAGLVMSLPKTRVTGWERSYLLGALSLDTVAVVAGTALAVAVRAAAGLGATSTTVSLSLLVPLLWLGGIALAGGYESRFLGEGNEEYRRVALGGLMVISVTLLVLSMLDTDGGRLFSLIALPVAFTATLLGRACLRQWLRLQRASGRFLHRTLLVGSPAQVSAVSALLSRGRGSSYEVVGACVPGVSMLQETSSVPIVGTVDMIRDIVDTMAAGTVAVIPGPDVDGTVVQRLSWALEPTGATLVVSPGLAEVAGPRLTLRPGAGLPFVRIEKPRFGGLRRQVKHALDPVLAAGALVLLAPVLAVIALAVKLDSSGPVLFRQTRVGRLGEPFRICKFRTMTVDAEARKVELMHLNEGSGPLFKLREDPRITRVGKVLRRTSLDELPQLFNVLLGQMSLVGPRPHLPEEVAMFGNDLNRRLLVRPGITGLWQVSGRSDLSHDEAMRLDLSYTDNWTLWLDLVILMRTIGVVLRPSQSGAY